MKNSNQRSRNDDNVYDDNDHGEKWMKTPPLYIKVWS